MELVSVKEFLKNAGLDYPNLMVLEANEQLYSTLLVQPKAVITVSESSITNAVVEESSTLFLSAIKLAHAKRVELLVTPEYSVPWNTLERALAETGGPEVGKLWVLGCESYPIEELASLKGRFTQFAQVLHEDVLPGQCPSTTSFLDPVVFLFRTTSIQSKDPVLVMLVQFKTCVSGDPTNVEARNMASGRSVYHFDGGASQIHLLTLICSDSFHFGDSLSDQCYRGLLLLHLQLNERPRENNYRRYRSRLFRTREDITEVIALNWAGKIEFILNGNPEPHARDNLGGSTWHSKAQQFETSDARIEQNHSRGVYYTRDPELRRHVLHFSYKPAAFLVQSTKVFHHGVEAARSYRTGPEVMEVYEWNKEYKTWAISHALDDGFQELTSHYGAPATELNEIHAASPLAVERILAITQGELGPRKDWYLAPNIDSVRTNETEILPRMTVTQDSTAQGFRDDRMRRMTSLARIRATPPPYSAALADLKIGFNFSWSKSEPHCNVVSLDGTSGPATLIYAGEGPARDDLSGLYAKAKSVVAGHVAEDRLAVVYREGNDIKVFEPPRYSSFTEASTDVGKNFTDPEK